MQNVMDYLRFKLYAPVLKKSIDYPFVTFRHCNCRFHGVNRWRHWWWIC